MPNHQIADKIDCRFSEGDREEIKAIIDERKFTKKLKETVIRWAKWVLTLPTALLGAYVAAQTIVQKVMESWK